MEFKCDCGTVCDLADNEQQTEAYGDVGQLDSQLSFKCKCCGKHLE
jgi:hypothetical protein